MFTKDDLIAAIKMVFDPEIPVNVWDLGLIYEINIVGANENSPVNAVDSRANFHSPLQYVTIKMTMTSPTCPMAEELLDMVKSAAESVAGIGNVSMELVWDPPWSLDKMSDIARLELDLTEEGW